MSGVASIGYTEEDIEAAVERIGESQSFAEAERIVAAAAPGLQRILADALAAGGWFGEAHESKVLQAATTPDEDERLTAVRTLLAEETRLGMMVGVAVGWALRDELEPRGEPGPPDDLAPGGEEENPGGEGVDR